MDYLLLLSDYNNITSLAVGICFAYIFISSRNTERNDQFFLKFLDNLAVSAIEKIAKEKKSNMDKPSKLQAQIDYYLGTANLDAETIGSFKDIKKQFSRIAENIMSLESEAKITVERRTSAKHLGKISLIIGMYGILALFLARRSGTP